MLSLSEIKPIEFNQIQINQKTVIRSKLTQFKYYEQDCYTDFLYDVKNLSDKELQDKYYNVDINNDTVTIDKDTLEIPLSQLLNEMEINRELTLDYYLNYKGDGTCWDANDYLYNECDTSSDNFIINKKNPTSNLYNNYNWESYNECVIQYTIACLNLNGEYVLAFEVQNGGDVRGNYSYLLFYTYTGDIEYLFDMIDSCYVYIDGINGCFHVRGSETEYFYYDYEKNKEYSFYFNTCDFIECYTVLLENNIGVYGETYEY